MAALDTLFSDDEMELLHDCRFTGVEIDERCVNLTFAVEGAKTVVQLAHVDRLVASPFLNGNIVHAVNLLTARSVVRDDLPVSDYLRSAFFDTYGLSESDVLKYTGRVLVLSASIGCELICAFAGEIKIRHLPPA